MDPIRRSIVGSVQQSGAPAWILALSVGAPSSVPHRCPEVHESGGVERREERGQHPSHFCFSELIQIAAEDTFGDGVVTIEGRTDLGDSRYGEIRRSKRGREPVLRKVLLQGAEADDVVAAVVVKRVRLGPLAVFDPRYLGDPATEVCGQELGHRYVCQHACTYPVLSV